MCFTVAGIDKNTMGHFRPNLFAIKPQMGNAINEPIDFNDAIHDDSSVVTLPVGSGDWSDVSSKSAGDGQPIHNPNTVPRSSTKLE